MKKTFSLYVFFMLGVVLLAEGCGRSPSSRLEGEWRCDLSATMESQGVSFDDPSAKQSVDWLIEKFTNMVMFIDVRNREITITMGKNKTTQPFIITAEDDPFVSVKIGDKVSTIELAKNEEGIDTLSISIDGNEQKQKVFFIKAQ